jgi:hypothetical protein
MNQLRLVEHSIFELPSFCAWTSPQNIKNNKNKFLKEVFINNILLKLPLYFAIIPFGLAKYYDSNFFKRNRN